MAHSARSTLMIAWAATLSPTRRRSNSRRRTWGSAQASGRRPRRSRISRSESHRGSSSSLRRRAFRPRGSEGLSTTCCPPLCLPALVPVARQNQRPLRLRASLIVGGRRQPDRPVAVIPLALAEEGNQLQFGPAAATFAHDLVDPAQEQRAAPNCRCGPPFLLTSSSRTFSFLRRHASASSRRRESIACAKTAATSC
jgi:hypothetical protein